MCVPVLIPVPVSSRVLGATVVAVVRGGVALVAGVRAARVGLAGPVEGALSDAAGREDQRQRAVLVLVQAGRFEAALGVDVQPAALVAAVPVAVILFSGDQR